jgi:hypothetical protein
MLSEHGIQARLAWNNVQDSFFAIFLLPVIQFLIALRQVEQFFTALIPAVTQSIFAALSQAKKRLSKLVE